MKLHKKVEAGTDGNYAQFRQEVFVRVCVFGASSSGIPQIYLDFAHTLGKRMAEEGMGLVFGAGQTGLMGECARGANSAGGEIIGVIPERLNIPGIYYENCTERIVTATMHERKAKMENLGDAFVALPGGFGTVEELMEVLTLKQLGYHEKPVVIANIDGFFNSLTEQFKFCVSQGFTHPLFLELYSVAYTVDEVLEQIKRKPDKKMPSKIEEALFSARLDKDKR